MESETEYHGLLNPKNSEGGRLGVGRWTSHDNVTSKIFPKKKQTWAIQVGRWQPGRGIKSKIESTRKLSKANSIYYITKTTNICFENQWLVQMIQFHLNWFLLERLTFVNFRWGPSSSNNSLPSHNEALVHLFLYAIHQVLFVFTGQVCFKGVLEFWDGNDEVNKFCFEKFLEKQHVQHMLAAGLKEGWLLVD